MHIQDDKLMKYKIYIVHCLDTTNTSRSDKDYGIHCMQSMYSQYAYFVSVCVYSTFTHVHAAKNIKTKQRNSAKKLIVEYEICLNFAFWSDAILLTLFGSSIRDALVQRALALGSFWLILSRYLVLFNKIKVTQFRREATSTYDFVRL